MAIKRDTVKYVAELARIALSEKELEQFTGQLDRILEYVNKLKALDVAGLEPTSHVLEMKNVYREDEVRPSLPAEEVLKNAPDKQGNLFRVKKIIEAL
ncbi:MAG: Asp-tRNA(Asn)/Glu-tRNA(Gln) amidotransferase subunit GatC [Candidatus Omnitrophica bacterium]|nr:Asp-tRNA(Asn)/Glu-tRNA(Gln) amidotransferase subunit GatC [Candidatus Omnitrophota bacterium]